DEAKNIFNIGSTKGQNSGSGSQILDIDDLSANTAHGPARDGRTIPHMVAPGCYIDSTDTTSSYGLKCGTSMASPHVSGAVALFIEYYRGLPGFIADPSPALVKAAFLPVARSLAGNLDADGGVLGQPFDSKQGWGRMDLEAVVDPADTVRYFDNPQILNNTGEEWTVSVSPADPGRPMRMMLVWTDAPGHGLGGSTPAWNNDLDLIVEAGATTYYGNNIGGSGWSTAGGSPDAINNTEGVFLGPTPPGAVTVRVRAADINSDGIPGVGDLTDQDFAFVCYNCAEEPGFGLAATPSNQATCFTTNVDYDIQVSSILGFSEMVTLSASGEPTGATVSFSPNPVAPGGSSTMTVSNMFASPPGTYAININGSSISLSRDTSVSLDVSTAPPGTPAITSPANGATGVPLVPTFTWAVPSQAGSYEFELATSSSFGGSIIDSGTTSDPEFVPGITLDSDTLYFARVRASNPCGDGGYSSVISFRTRDVPAVLLVDDDDNSPNTRSYYTDALDALGIGYDVWDTNNTDNEPAIADLNQYGVVIWFSGDEFGGACGPGSAGESALAAWLDGGDRCLLISSQDYLYDRGLTSFLSGYLGVASYTSDVTQTTATGSGSVYGGMGPYALSYSPLSNWSDRVSPAAGAELAFSGNAGDAAVNKDAGAYRTSFFGFPLEALALADRMAVIDQAVSWCAPPPPNCPGDANGDLMVDFDDLNEVLTDWGMTVPPGTGGDVTGNGTVDFDDLNTVLENWANNCN
ncbi:MAG: S8 family serine peptidase, partial [Phycisphaerales bacterium]|nr:S8 family serine peptidase [Phycisphaerales bacterium]